MSHEGVTQTNGSPSQIAAASRIGLPPGFGPDGPAAHVIRTALRVGDQRLRQNDPMARRGDVEGVHRLRTAARRLRSELRLFRGLLEGHWAGRLANELRWLGRLLGSVRDPDVMHQRLGAVAGPLIGDLGPLFGSLARRQSAASSELREAFASDRYHDLLELVADSAENATLRDEAWEPCRTALPSLVRGTWRRLRSAGRSLDLSDADEAYHEVRKRAKRARYSAESVAAALDAGAANDARRFARRAIAVQDILGEHQDATIACREIRRIAAGHAGDGPFNLAAGRLLERQEIAADAARAGFFKVWHQLDRKKNRGWMKV